MTSLPARRLLRGRGASALPAAPGAEREQRPGTGWEQTGNGLGTSREPCECGRHGGLASPPFFAPLFPPYSPFSSFCPFLPSYFPHFFSPPFSSPPLPLLVSPPAVFSPTPSFPRDPNGIGTGHGGVLHDFSSNRLGVLSPFPFGLELFASF